MPTRNTLLFKWVVDLWERYKRKKRIAKNIKEAKDRDPFIY